MPSRVAAWIALSLLVGCGGDGLRLAPVKGVVTYNGQPVEGAGVVFAPLDAAQGPPASGSTDAQGRFTLMTNNRPGAAIGEHRVTISKDDPFGDEIAAEELESADFVRRKGLKVFKTKHHLPPQYADINTSGLTATVENKENEFPFQLSGQ